MKPEFEKLTPLKDKGMCSHGNFLPCTACDEADKDKKTENTEESGKEDSGELKVETARLENMLGSAKNLVGVLHERDGDGLNPLIEENELSRFSAALHDGEELLNKKTATQDEVESIITKIICAVEEIGNASGRRNMNDSLESLQKVASRIKRMRDDAHEMGASIVKTEGKSDRTLSIIKRLEETLNEKQVSVKKKQDKLTEYFGR